MRTNLLTVLAVSICFAVTASSTSAQNAILAQMYGKGVHAYFSGDQTAARQFLSMAINNGSDDPRAYYFRGMVSYASGNSYEAESYWQRGATLEAQGRTNPFVGRSLTRFQGAGRLKLEGIRQQARLQAMAIRAARSNQRLGEISGSTAAGNTVDPQPTPPPPTTVPSEPAPEATTAPAVTDPFAAGDLAEGEAQVTEEDALEAAMDDPFANDPAAPAAAEDAAEGDLFDGGADDSDPFAAGGDDAGAMENDDADEDDPFAE